MRGLKLGPNNDQWDQSPRNCNAHRNHQAVQCYDDDDGDDDDNNDDDEDEDDGDHSP